MVPFGSHQKVLAKWATQYRVNTITFYLKYTQFTCLLTVTAVYKVMSKHLITHLIIKTSIEDRLGKLNPSSGNIVNN